MYKSARWLATTMKTSCGFTLIEILVVIGIIAGVVAMVLPQLSQFNKSQGLQNAAQGLQTAIRQTQNNATSGTKCNTTTGASYWSIVFTSTTSYSIVGMCSNGNIGSTTTYNFPSGISITAINIDSSGSWCPITSFGGSPQPGIAFLNVSGSVVFAGDTGCPAISATGMIITLQSASSGGGASVRVEKGGAISVYPDS